MIAAVSLLAFFTLTALAVAHGSASRPPWIDAFAWSVAVCESGKGHNHPDPQHHRGSYEGAWGWFAGTWDLDKPAAFPDHAYQATLRQQLRVFRIGRSRGRYWGCIANGGYRSWMP